MTSRPRRSAAARAQENISVHAKWADSSDKIDRATMSSRRSGRTSGPLVTRDPPSSPGDDSHLSVTVKLPSTKLRQATQASKGRVNPFAGGEIVQGKRNRGGKKSYVVDSSPDDDDDEEEEEEEEDEIDDDEDDDEDAEADEDMEVDAEGEDVDAEGEEDAEGDIDMSMADDSIQVSRSSRPKPPARAAASKVVSDDDDDDDDELSEPGDSDINDETMGYGDETMADEDEDAEGEEIEVAGEEDEDEDEDAEGDTTMAAGAAADADSDDLGSDDDIGTETPDLAKMTKRQRARFEDAPQEYMKLSDEIQVKKVFTAEELSMRRQEMARRRRNLSEKRNEEVKMETINKLLKKQAPKINRKAAAAAAAARGESSDTESNKPNPLFLRWVSNKNGNRLSVPTEIVEGPGGRVFGPPKGLPSGKMVEEVA